MPRFTLRPRQWYAMECIFPDATRHHSPIWLKEIIQQPGLEGRLDIEFYHANYPEGVRDKLYQLRVARRAKGYLLAEMGEKIQERRLVIIEAITRDWLLRHFPNLRFTATDAASLAAELDLGTGRVARG